MAFQGDSIYWVEVEKVVPNPFQPRREFDQSKLQELADSIRMYGVLQPLTVTRKEVQQEGGTFYTEYELIAGERRLRASRLAGVAQVPVIIREGEQSEQEKLELAIIENLQREDLNAVDRAIAFRQLAEQFNLSHAQVAQKVGRSREYVSNSIRLLGLPEHMLTSLKQGDMMEGHARTLLMLTDRPEEQEVVYKEILLKKLSVREVERIVRKIATDKVRKKTPGEFDATLIAFEKQFTETLGTRVQIQKTDFGGKLTIDYFSEEDLSSILARIKEEVAEQGRNEKDMAERLSTHTPLAVEEGSDNTVPEKTEQPEVPRPETPAVEIENSHQNNPAEEPAAEYPNADSFRRDEAGEQEVPEVQELPQTVNEHQPQPEVSSEETQTEQNPSPNIYSPRSVQDAPVNQPTPMYNNQNEEKSEPKQTKTNDDDSGLYSISSFTV